MGIRSSEGSSSHSNNITEDETALYDRQIRLWGFDSQKRLRNADVLLIGLNGLGAEVAKNIVLAGVKSITLLDDKTVSQVDYTAQFLVSRESDGKNRAEASYPNLHQLNPNVVVKSDNDCVTKKDDSFFLDFSVVCATDCSLEYLLRLDKICRDHEIKFFCGDTWGMHGYCFTDLGNYTYAKKEIPGTDDGLDEPAAKRAKENPPSDTIEYDSLEKVMSMKSGKAGVSLHKKISKVFFLVHVLFKFREEKSRYPSADHHTEDVEALKTMRKSVMQNLGFDESKLSDNDLENVFGEVSPVCAILGGVLGQEIIRVICGDKSVLRNVFLFNGDDSSGIVEHIG